jgi:hypothetical protein
MRYRKRKCSSSNVKARASSSRAPLTRSIDRYRYLPRRNHRVSHERTLLMGRAGLAASRSALPCERKGYCFNPFGFVVAGFESCVDRGGVNFNIAFFEGTTIPLAARFATIDDKFCVLTTVGKGRGERQWADQSMRVDRSTGRFVEAERNEWECDWKNAMLASRKTENLERIRSSTRDTTCALNSNRAHAPPVWLTRINNHHNAPPPKPKTTIRCRCRRPSDSADLPSSQRFICSRTPRRLAVARYSVE